MFDKFLMALAVIFMAPFVLAAGLVVLTLLTAFFALSIKIIFFVGGAIAVVAAMIYFIDFLIEKYGQRMASETGGTTGRL